MTKCSYKNSAVKCREDAEVSVNIGINGENEQQIPYCRECGLFVVAIARERWRHSESGEEFIFVQKELKP